MKNATFLLLGKWKQRSNIPSIPPQWQHEQRDEQAPQLPNHDLWLHLQEQSNPSFWKPTRKPATERETGYFPSFSTEEHPGWTNTEDPPRNWSRATSQCGPRILAVGSHPYFEFFCSWDPKATTPITKAAAQSADHPQAEIGNISTLQHVTWLATWSWMRCPMCWLAGWAKHGSRNLMTLSRKMYPNVHRVKQKQQCYLFELDCSKWTFQRNDVKFTLQVLVE